MQLFGGNSFSQVSVHISWGAVLRPKRKIWSPAARLSVTA